MERIAKYIARRGIGSRRQVEQMIVDGRITCNGVRLSSPALLVSNNDTITIDNQPLPTKEPIRLWRYYKPCGLITTFHDPQGRATVFDHLPKTMPKVIAVGRLDLNSEGLLLLTNSGSLAHYLEHPKNALVRTYKVRIHGQCTPIMIAQMKKGLTIDGIHYAPMRAQALNNKQTSANTWVIISLTEGKNREVRKVFAYFGLSVSRLIRLEFASFILGDLKPQECSEVSTEALQEALGNDIFNTLESAPAQLVS